MRSVAGTLLSLTMRFAVTIAAGCITGWDKLRRYISLQLCIIISLRSMKRRARRYIRLLVAASSCVVDRCAQVASSLYLFYFLRPMYWMYYSIRLRDLLISLSSVDSGKTGSWRSLFLSIPRSTLILSSLNARILKHVISGERKHAPRASEAYARAFNRTVFFFWCFLSPTLLAAGFYSSGLLSRLMKRIARWGNNVTRWFLLTIHMPRKRILDLTE